MEDQVKAVKALLGVLAFSAIASASIVLNISDGNGTGPFGNISLTQVDSSTVTVMVTADGTYEFVDTGSHNTFGFNLFNSTVVNPNISITGLTSGFYAGSGFSNGFAGSFVYSVDCASAAGKPPDACGSGGSSPAPGPFSFTVHNSGGSLSITDFTPNAATYTFAADVIGPNATGATFTGLVESTGSCANGGVGCNNSTVPEPITSGLVGTGLISLFFLRRRVRG